VTGARSTRTLALALALAACGGGRAAPHDPATQSPTTAADAGVDAGPDVAMLAELADGLAETLATMAELTTSAPDCATMAINLERLFDQASPLFDLARAQASDPAAARLLTAAMDARAAEVGPRVERISRGLARCQRDPAVAAAMARMPTF
jgi:hypothetical protein